MRPEVQEIIEERKKKVTIQFQSLLDFSYLGSF